MHDDPGAICISTFANNYHRAVNWLVNQDSILIIKEWKWPSTQKKWYTRAISPKPVTGNIILLQRFHCPWLLLMHKNDNFHCQTTAQNYVRTAYAFVSRTFLSLCINHVCTSLLSEAQCMYLYLSIPWQRTGIRVGVRIGVRFGVKVGLKVGKSRVRGRVSASVN